MVHCAWYHGVAAGTAMLSGLLLVGLGIFLKVQDPLQNIKLAFTEGTLRIHMTLGTSLFNRGAMTDMLRGVCSSRAVQDSSINKYLGSDYILIFVGFTLIIVAITGLFVAKKWPGRPLAVGVYTVVLFGMIAALVFVSVFTLSLSNGKVLFEIDSKLERAWVNTIKIAPGEACQIQKELDCYGFRDKQCAGCARVNGSDAICTAGKRAICPMCENMPTRTNVGCYEAFMHRTSALYKPTGIVAGVIAGALLIDSFVVCAL